MQVLRDRIIWGTDDFMAGLVPQFGNNSVRVIGRGKGQSGASYMSNFDPYYVIPGMAFPAKAGTDASAVSVIDAVAVSAPYNSGDSYAYPMAGSKIHKLDVTGNSLESPAFKTLAGAGVHAAHNSFSMALCSGVVYPIAGVNKIFYPYNDNTDWDVGMFNLSSTFDDDYMTSVPTNPLADNWGGDANADYLTQGVGKPHHLYVSTNDGLLYIPSGRYVHAFDGSNSTFYGAVFTVQAGYDVISIGETGYDLVLFICPGSSGRRGDAQAYFYSADRPLDPYKKIILDDDFVTAGFNFGGTVGCFTGNRNSGRITLRIWNGAEFVPKFYYTGSGPVPHGIETQDNLIKWNDGGVTYVYGAKDGDFPESRISSNVGGGSSNGFLRTFVAGQLYMSSGTTSAGGLQLFASGYGASASWQGLTAVPTFPAGKVGRVKEVIVTFADIASGGRSLALQLKSNMEQTTTTVFTGVTSVTASTLKRRYLLDSSGGPLPKFESLKPNLVWSAGSGSSAAPGIKQIEAIFELRNI